MFLEVLRSLEGFATELALMGLQGDVNSNVRRDVIALYSSCSALAPGAG